MGSQFMFGRGGGSAVLISELSFGERQTLDTSTDVSQKWLCRIQLNTDLEVMLYVTETSRNL